MTRPTIRAVTLRTIDAAGHEITRQIMIEPVPFSCEWRVVGEDEQRNYDREYEDRKRGERYGQAQQIRN